MSLLTIKDLQISLRKGERKLVHNLSVELEKGQSLILLGASGCGKTMTCRAVMGLLDERRFVLNGAIMFDGKALNDLPGTERRRLYGGGIAFIPQNPMTALDPSCRIGRQMDETLRIHSSISHDARKREIMKALSEAGLDDAERVYRAYPHMLSGGMLQRVLIAMALMSHAQLVIADEPTTALDVVHRNATVDAFIRLRELGAAVLMVTHDFAAALRLGGKVLVMKDGRIIESGDVGQIWEAPQADYTRALIHAAALSKGERDAES